MSCFVAMPFADQRAVEIYEAIRATLEDGPYFWRVVRADDNVEARGLWSNLKAKLMRAHCYIAILTADVNPNVMIEIGRMEALERPLVMLHDVAAPMLPADLQGPLYEEVRSSGTELRVEVSAALSRQQTLQKLTSRDLYLSETVLTRHAGLNQDISRLISRNYPTWHEFMNTDSTAIADTVGISLSMVRAVKETLITIQSAQRKARDNSRLRKALRGLDFN